MGGINGTAGRVRALEMVLALDRWGAVGLVGVPDGADAGAYVGSWLADAEAAGRRYRLTRAYIGVDLEAV